MPIKREFGNQVRQLRGNQSQREFGAAAGVSHTMISNMEFGRVPKYGTLVGMIASLGLGTAARRRLMVSAGYTEDTEHEEYDGRLYWVRRLNSLGKRYPGRRLEIILSDLPTKETPPEVIDQYIRLIEAELKDENDLKPTRQDGADPGARRSDRRRPRAAQPTSGALAFFAMEDTP